MIVPFILPLLLAYVCGIVIGSAVSVWWSVLAAACGIVFKFWLKRIEPLYYCLLLALGILMAASIDTPKKGTTNVRTTIARTDSIAYSLNENFGESAALRESMTYALLLGDKSRLPNDLKKELRQAGMSHLMAVSGLHVGVIWMLLGWLLAPLRLITEHRMWGRAWNGEDLRILLLIASMWCYVVSVGLPPSAVRAGVMLTLVSLEWFFGGGGGSWHSLGVAAFVLLFSDPGLLYQVGFQLSFLAVAGILVFGPIVSNYKEPAWFRLLVLTLSAQLYTLPVVAYVFHTVPVFGWLQGVLVVPILPVYLCLLSMAAVFPTVGVIEWLANGCTTWMLLVARWTNLLEEWCIGGHLTLHPTLWEAWLLMLFIVGTTLWWRYMHYRESLS